MQILQTRHAHREIPADIAETFYEFEAAGKPRITHKWHIDPSCRIEARLKDSHSVHPMLRWAWAAWEVGAIRITCSGSSHHAMVSMHAVLKPEQRPVDLILFVDRDLMPALNEMLPEQRPLFPNPDHHSYVVTVAQLKTLAGAR